MKEKRDYIRDITQMHTLMERSSRFMSLSALACILVGVYALSGALIAYQFLDFDLAEQANLAEEVIFLAITILILAIGTAIILSRKKANRNGERTWNPTVRRLLLNMAVPLIAGGLLILLLIAKGMIGLVAPFSLLFYGLALFNASKFSFDELRSLGLIEIVLGLVGSYFVEFGLLFWALGFGVVHIIYGIYLHYKYER